MSIMHILCFNQVIVIILRQYSKLRIYLLDFTIFLCKVRLEKLVIQTCYYHSSYALIKHFKLFGSVYLFPKKCQNMLRNIYPAYDIRVLKSWPQICIYPTNTKTKKTSVYMWSRSYHKRLHVLCIVDDCGEWCSTPREAGLYTSAVGEGYFVLLSLPDDLLCLMCRSKQAVTTP